MDNVKHDHRKSKLEYPGEKGEYKLDKNVGCYVLWRKRDIEFGDSNSESNSESSSSPRVPMPSPPRQEQMSSPPRQEQMPSPPRQERMPSALAQSRGATPSTMSSQKQRPPMRSVTSQYEAPPKKTTSSQQQAQPNKRFSSESKKPQSPLSYEKTDEELTKSVNASVTKFMAQFKKSSPPKKTAETLEQEYKMLLCLKRTKPAPQSDYKHIMFKESCMKKSDEILKEKDQETIEREFLESAGITKEQLLDDSKIETAKPTSKRFVVGKPMIEEFMFEECTQTRRYHKWYMDQAKAGRQMFAFQYKHNDFLHGDNEVWICWDEMYQLLQADALGAQLICLWSL